MSSIVGSAFVGLCLTGSLTLAGGPMRVGMRLFKFCEDRSNSIVVRIAILAVASFGTGMSLSTTLIVFPWALPTALGTYFLIRIFKMEGRIYRIGKKIFHKDIADFKKINFNEDVHDKQKILETFSHLKEIKNKNKLFFSELSIDERHFQTKKLQEIPNPPVAFSDSEREEEILRLFDSTQIEFFNDDGEKREKQVVREEIKKKLDFFDWFTIENNNVFDLLINYFKNNPNDVEAFIIELGAAAFHCSARITTLLSDFYVLYVRPDLFGSLSGLQTITRLYQFLESRRKEILDHAATFKGDGHAAATHAWVRRKIGPEFGVWDILSNSDWDKYSYVGSGNYAKASIEDVQAKFKSCYTPVDILRMLREELDKGSDSRFSFTHLQKWFDVRHVKSEDFTDMDENGDVTVKNEALLYFLIATHVLQPPKV